MKKEIYYEKRKSTKSDKEYIALYVDVGYRQLALTMDNAVIVELSGKTFAEINAIQLGEKVVIGYLEA